MDRLLSSHPFLWKKGALRIQKGDSGDSANAPKYTTKSKNAKFHPQGGHKDHDLSDAVPAPGEPPAS
jgi:hypothetical protein